MICCMDCFDDKEVKAAIEMIGHRGIVLSVVNWIHGFMIRILMVINRRLRIC